MPLLLLLLLPVASRYLQLLLLPPGVLLLLRLPLRYLLLVLLLAGGLALGLGAWASLSC